jgi:hypothetical protein
MVSAAAGRLLIKRNSPLGSKAGWFFSEEDAPVDATFHRWPAANKSGSSTEGGMHGGFSGVR